MTEVKIRNRQQAVDELARHGVAGSELYLIDVIPLVEMIWADGHAQDGEISILDDFLRQHVAHINDVAGYALLTFEQAKLFVGRYLKDRPDQDLLRTLRSLIPPARMSGSDDELNQKLRTSMLAACIDIASSSVTQYPYPLSERFNYQEKQCFFEIVESLGRRG